MISIKQTKPNSKRKKNHPIMTSRSGFTSQTLQVAGESSTGSKKLRASPAGLTAADWAADTVISPVQRVALTLGAVPTNVGWALSESLMIAYLLELRCPHYVVSWVWLFSPLLSAFLGPLLDSYLYSPRLGSIPGDRGSNHRNCFGVVCDPLFRITERCIGVDRRKHCIFWLSLFSAILMLGLPRSHYFVRVIFDTKHAPAAAVLCVATVIFTMMDLCHYLLLRPLQSLLIDCTLGSGAGDYATLAYNNTIDSLTVTQGLSRAGAYALAASLLQWEVFGDKVQHFAAIFTIAAIVVFFSGILCVTLSPNPPLPGDVTARRGLSNDFGYEEYGSIDDKDAAASAVERKVTAGRRFSASMSVSSVGLRMLDDDMDDPSLMPESEMSRLLRGDSESDIDLAGNTERTAVQAGRSVVNDDDSPHHSGRDGSTSLSAGSVASDTLDENRDNNQRTSLVSGSSQARTSSIPSDFDNNNNAESSSSSVISNQMRWAFYTVVFAQFCGWISTCSVVYFWAVFCAHNVYDGQPRQDSNDRDFKRFENGLMFGIFGLFIMALMALLTSILYPSLDVLIGDQSTRKLFIMSQLMMCLILFSIFMVGNMDHSGNGVDDWIRFTLLMLISLFGVPMELHLQTTHRLSETELKPMFKEIQNEYVLMNGSLLKNNKNKNEHETGTDLSKDDNRKREEQRHKNVVSYLIELGGMLAPTLVALLGGPLVYLFGNDYRWAFIFPAVLMLPVDLLVYLIFEDFIDWKLPPTN